MCNGSAMMDMLYYSILLVLSAFHPHLTATAERRFGCLFEDDLCLPFEICINDNIFGRCQRVSVIDIYKYEVSPPVLQHLRTILQKLSHRGLTWKDDATQQVVSSELLNLRKIHFRRPEVASSESPTIPRTMKQGSEKEWKFAPEDDTDVAMSLQQYLKYLGFLPKTAAPALRQKAINTKPLMPQGKASPLTFSPPSHQQPAESPPRTAAQTQPEQIFSQMKSELDEKERMDSARLIAALETYMAQKTATPNLDSTSLNDKTKGSQLSANQLYPSRLIHEDGTNVKQDQDPYKSKNPLPVKPETRLLFRPNAAATNYKSSSRPPASKDPLSVVDETFIQNVVKQLGKHSVNVERLSPKELDELADVIADALQVVDAKHGGRSLQERGEQTLKRMDMTDEDKYEREETYEETDVPDNNFNQEAKEPGGQHEMPAIQTETDLDIRQKGLSQYSLEDSSSEMPFKLEAKKSEELDSSSEEESYGVENVKSETFSRDLAIEKKADHEPDSQEAVELQQWIHSTLMRDQTVYEEASNRNAGGLQLAVKSGDKDEYGYIMTDKDSLSVEKGLELIKDLSSLLKLPMTAFSDVNVLGAAVTFKVRPNSQNLTTADVANAAESNKVKLEKSTGLKIQQSGTGEKSKLKLLPHTAEKEDSTKFIVLTLISIVCIIGVLVASGVISCLRHNSHHKLKEKLTSLGTETSSDATSAYQELCRQRMAVKVSDRPEPLHTSRINSISSQFSDGPMPSPTARSSTSSWCEEPVQSNMDISTGHMILSYMEDHLKNKNRLEKEWDALCAYQAEPNATSIAHKESNRPRNRSQSVVAYDHCRIILKAEANQNNSDYVNASPIMDHDPRNPAYIAAQGPLPETAADFWQMVWENGCVVIVMLTPLTENGVKQCHPYWPEEGSDRYHIYEVNLVSEHIWCEDFLVRSFYLKNVQSNETRTVTQFHFLSWRDKSVPPSTRSLLDFRRKVNKCYRGRSCPIIVHCSDGAGRSGTYILIDMVLNKMAKGAKEIDIAATLEHLRDQRPGMVQTKEQFEFALTAVAEEVNAILKALPH
ncbi:receptor-type tyrosine-protein phosphatase N2 isoform X2 [Protopterus annectens]|uniref:receptor-type tyrosine-protein phosphatase N2 isoform X2 n=1 Tax=Protopterus annectens TaxID=7888 RepID=UPI001CFADA1A|nr:receptor-type tyrosine-protein phosphatase N2 isoform X2 [Protopterus annectens]